MKEEEIGRDKPPFYLALYDPEVLANPYILLNFLLQGLQRTHHGKYRKLKHAISKEEGKARSYSSAQIVFAEVYNFRRIMMMHRYRKLIEEYVVFTVVYQSDCTRRFTGTS